MKFTALILSIYILTLNFAPCQDNSFVDSDSRVEISQIIDLDQSPSHIDLCSPFCQCHCCHIHATYFNAVGSSLSSNIISTEIFSHFDNLGKEIPNSILQPPRV